jgi:hypothetical protein
MQTSNQKGRLYFLIGLPRSGKSTIANNWLNHKISFANNNEMWKNIPPIEPDPRVVVCRDEIRLAMGHRWNGVVEPHVNAVANTMVRALLQHHNVLLDETHTSKSTLLQTLQIDPDAIWYFVDTKSDVCKQRARDSNQTDLYGPIDRMVGNLIKLCNCGWDTIPHELPRIINGLRQQARDNKPKFERIVD